MVIIPVAVKGVAFICKKFRRGVGEGRDGAVGREGLTNPVKESSQDGSVAGMIVGRS